MFTCWLVLIADLGYTLTFGRHDPAILRNSLIADVALPVLLIIQAPPFFREARGLDTVREPAPPVSGDAFQADRARAPALPRHLCGVRWPGGEPAF